MSYVILQLEEREKLKEGYIKLAIIVSQPSKCLKF